MREGIGDGGDVRFEKLNAIFIRLGRLWDGVRDWKDWGLDIMGRKMGLGGRRLF